MANHRTIHKQLETHFPDTMRSYAIKRIRVPCILIWPEATQHDVTYSSGWANVEIQLGEVTWGDSPRISAEHKFKCTINVGTLGDAGWVDSLLAPSDITVVCGPTADFTLVTPVSSPACPEKNSACNYLCVRTYSTRTSFELIFMKFACLMRVHPWVNHIVFENKFY